MPQIKKSVFDAIIAHARRELPVEACGYLAGSEGIITAHYEMTNIDASAEHYSFDVREQFNVIKEVRAKGLRILANYHSHPETPARPSEEDISLANDPNIGYVIISLADGSADARLFRIQHGIVEKEELEVIEDVKV
jgi:proteasome lid subunit RPN8/RPN11